MGYFRELPNLYYKSFLTDQKSSLDYVEVKNLFRRVKLRNDLHNILTIFDRYQIPQGYRPELVAEDIYGDQDLDWVLVWYGIMRGLNLVRMQYYCSINVVLMQY